MVLTTIESQAKLSLEKWILNNAGRGTTTAATTTIPKTVAKTKKPTTIEQALMLLDANSSKTFSEEIDDLKISLEFLDNVLSGMRKIQQSS